MNPAQDSNLELNISGKKLTLNEAARVLGISDTSLRRYETSQKITAERTDQGYRLFDINEINRFKFQLEKEREEYRKKVTEAAHQRLSENTKKAAFTKFIKSQRKPAFAMAVGVIVFTFLASLGLNNKSLNASASSLRNYVTQADNWIKNNIGIKSLASKKGEMSSNVLSAADRNASWIFSINAPAIFTSLVTAENDINVQGNLAVDGLTTLTNLTFTGVGLLNNVLGIDAVTQATIANGLEIAGDVEGALGETTVVALNGETLGDTTAEEGFILMAVGGEWISTSTSEITELGSIQTGTWEADPIGIEFGGTGLSSFTTGGLLYATSPSELTLLAIGTKDYILTSDGTAPSWQPMSSAASAFATTGVTAGTGLTGGGTTGVLTLNVGAGSGITVTADDITIDASTAGVTSTTASNSGLEVVADGLRLLGGCADSQSLIWDSARQVWQCSTASGSVGGTGSAGNVAFWLDADTLSNSDGFYWNNSTQTLGIGTSAPQYKLHVAGSLFATTANLGQINIAGDNINDLTGNGLATSGSSLTIDATTTGSSSVTASNSGLEVTSSGLKLLGGCGSYQLLAWDQGSEMWRCSTVAGAGGIAGSGGAGQVTFWDGLSSLSGTNEFYWDNVGTKLGLGTTAPTSKLTIAASDAAALQINPFGVSSGNTGEMRFLELAANGVNYTGFKSPDNLNQDIIYTLPNSTSPSDYVLTYQSNGQLEWKAVSGIGGVGDITSVGSIISGSAFSDSTADAQWLGLGASAGNIQFFDRATDNISFNNANVGIGTTNPQNILDVYAGSTDLGGARINGAANNIGLTLGNSGTGGITYYLLSAADTSDAGQASFSIYDGSFHRFVINSGNIGIGTTNPSQKLDIGGAIRLGTSSLNNVLNTSSVGAAPTGDLFWGDRTLVDSSNVATYATTGVTAGSGLTGGGTVGVLSLDIGAGNGIVVNANDITLDIDTAGATSVTASNSGLELTSDGLRLLGGCSDTQTLAWDSGMQAWKCVPTTGGTLSGNGVATRIAFWNSSGSIASNQALYWDNTNMRLGVGTSSPSFTGDFAGTVRSYTLVSQELILGSSNANILNSYAGHDAYTNFNGGIGTGGKDSLLALQRLTTQGNLVNIGSIQGGEVTLTSGGTFGTATTYPAFGTGPQQVAVADVTGDGKLDIIDVNSGTSNSVSILINNGSGTFSTTTTFPALGVLSATPAVADFNGDGKNDIAVTNRTSGTIAIFTNGGTGTFTSSGTYPVRGITPIGIVASDLNGDGKADIAVTNNSTSANSMSIFINSGTGTFGTATTYPAAGIGTSGIVATDINNDGKTDIVVSNDTSNSIATFINAGTGTFGTATTYPSQGTSPDRMAATDVTGDGKVDIVVANGGSATNSVAVFTNSGTGTFGVATTYPVLGSGPSGVGLGDLNGDGKADIAVANNTSNSISVFTNSGIGTFGVATTYPSLGLASKGIAMGDLNGDGKADIVVSNTTSNSVSVFTNQTSTMFNANASTGNLGIGITASSTKLSIAGGTIIGSNGFIFGRTAPTHGLQIEGRLGIGLSSPSYQLDVTGTARVADLLTQDIVLTASSYSLLSGVRGYNGHTNFSGGISTGFSDKYSFNNAQRITASGNLTNIGSVQAGEALFTGGGTFSGSTYPTRGVTPTQSAIGDLNGDGFPDIATANFSTTTNSMSIFINNGNGTFGTATTYPAAGILPTGVSISDLNGDGKGDVALTNNTSNSISVFTNLGSGTFGAAITYPTRSVAPQEIATGDLNNDGKPDIAVASQTSSSISTFINNGDGTFGAASTYPSLGVSAQGMSFFDINGDGKLDILTTNQTSNSIATFTNNGNGTFGTAVTVPSRGVLPSITAVADFNNDGKQDAAVSNLTSNTLGIFINGGGTLGAATTYPSAGTSPAGIAAADFNGDGVADVAQVNGGTNSLAVFTNDGYGTFGAATTYPSMGGTANGLAAGDLNNDGKIDLVSTNFSASANSITVFLNQPRTLLFANAANGLVGIGTTAPTEALTIRYDTNGSSVVSVSNQTAGTGAYAGFSAASDSASGLVMVTSATKTPTADIPADAMVVRSETTASGGLMLAAGGANSVNIATNTTVRMTVDSSGNIGIGVTPSSNKLSIAGNAVIGSNGYIFGRTAPSNGLSVEGRVGIGVTAGPGYALDVAGVARAYNLASQELILGQGYNTNVLSSYMGFDGYTNFSGGIGTGNKDNLLSAQRITASGNLVNIGSIQAGEALFTGGGTFTFGTTYPSLGSNALGMTTKDFNQDGNIDVAIANNSSNSVSVFTSNADGTFNTATTYPSSGSQPREISSGDLNGDGKPDLFFTNVITDSVGILMNNGNGTFMPSVTYPAGNGPYGVSVGDLNSDGKADLLHTNHTDGSIGVRLNTGDGTFGAATTYPTLGVGPRDTQIADLNGDGKPDIAFINETSASFGTFINNGNGTFGTATTYPSLGSATNGMAVTDFNGDNKPDVAHINNSTDSFTVRLNSGSGIFGAGVTYPTLGPGPHGMMSGDVNGDGKPDIAFVNTTPTSSVAVYINAGGGTFGAATTFPARGNPKDIAIIDINKDGRNDLVVQNTTSIATFINQPTTLFHADANTGNIGIGLTNAGIRLTISNNTVASLVAPSASGTVVQIAGANGASAKIAIDSFDGPSGSAIDFRAASTSAATPGRLSTDQTIGSLHFLGYGATDYSSQPRARIIVRASEVWSDSAQGTYMMFNTTSTGAATNGGTERMRITPEGNITIGTTIPQAKLVVNGNAIIGSNAFIAGRTAPPGGLLVEGSVGIGVTSAVGWLASPLAVVNLPSSTGITLVADGSGNFFKQSSSLRYKNHIEDLDVDFNKLLDLRPVSYKYKSTGAESIGYIAEEMEEIDEFPGLLVYNENGQVEGIQYQLMTVYLKEIIKEQKGNIEDLTDRVNALESTQDDNQDFLDLVSRVAALEDAPNEFENIDDRVSFLEEIIGLAEESSESSESSGTNGFLSNLQEIIQGATEDFSNMLAELGLSNNDGELTVEADLNVLGNATFNDVTITGNLNIGQFNFDTIENSLDITGAACYNETTEVLNTELCELQALNIQKGLAGNVNIFDGKVVISPDGTMTIDGSVKANKVTADEYVVTEASQMTGSAVLGANTSSITIANPNIKLNSKVFVTATSSTNGQALIVSNKENGSAFTVSVDSLYGSDITFDWWILNVD